MSTMFPALIRPQYPATPDVLQSALAWSFTTASERDDGEGSNQRRPLGLVYQREAETQPKNVRILSTRPALNGDSGEEWIRSLREQRMISRADGSDGHIAKAIADALTGIEPIRGANITAAPLTPNIALLQNAAGAMGVANPPAFAKLLNQIYALGAPRDGTTSTAAQDWLRAVSQLASEGPLKRIDAAVFDAVVRNWTAHKSFDWSASGHVGNAAAEVGADSIPPWWRSRDFDAASTPMGWFYSAWKNLCRDEWVRALPPRRWSDWASCLLRHALGFTFLWEARFYITCAEFIIARDPTWLSAAKSRIEGRGNPLLPWATGGSISARDVKPSTRSMLAIGLSCRAVLVDMSAQLVSASPASLAELLKALSSAASDITREELHRALSGAVAPAGLNNLIETVEYSLLCRRESGRSADYYGLTKSVSRRFTHIAPSPEWIVVMASLASDQPGEPTRLADVMSWLQRLGLQPRIDVLVTELERAGLCASAPDGDQGIEVSPAFGV